MIHYFNAIIFDLNYIKTDIEKIIIGIQISKYQSLELIK